MTQYGRPIGDISVGNWTDEGPSFNDGNLYTSIQEVSQDGNTSRISIIGTTNPIFEVALTSLTDPLTGANHTVHIWTRSDGGGAPERFNAWLYEGTTPVCQLFGNAAFGRHASNFTEHVYTLDGPTEADTIEDYTELRIRLEITIAGGTETGHVTQVYIEIPDPAGIDNLDAVGITTTPVLGVPTVAEPGDGPVREQVKTYIGEGEDLPGYLAFDSDVKAGSLLVAVFNAFVNLPTNVITITDDNGNTWQAAQVEEYKTTNQAGIWYAVDANAGATTVSFDDALGQSVFITVVILEYSNVDTVSPLDQSNEGTGTGTTWNSGDITTLQDDEVLIGLAAQDDSNVTHDEDSPWDLIFESNDYSFLTISVSEIIVTSTLTDAYTGGFGTSVVWYSTVVSFKAAAGDVDNLVAVGITANPVLGIPTIGQTHVLTSVGITADPVLGIPTATHIHDLIAVGITADPVLGIPTATHIHDLIAVDITADPVLGVSTIGQTHDLIAVSITADPILGIPTVAEAGAGDVKIAAVRVAAKTSSGTQTITTSDLGGLTPKAAVLIMTQASSDGTPTDVASISFGAVHDATHRWVIATRLLHNDDTPSSKRRMTEDEVIMLMDPVADTVLCEADFDSWVTNGMVIDWGATNPSTGFLITVWFFAGDDVEAWADTIASLPTTLDSTTDYTDGGFEPAFSLFASCRSFFNDTTNSNCMLSFGLAANDGSETNFSLNVAGGAMGSISANAATALNDAFMNDLWLGSNFGAWQISAFLSNGFTVKNIKAGTDNLGYLSIGFKGTKNVWLGDTSVPTSPGNDVETGPGWTPEALIGGYLMTDSGFQAGAAPSNDQAGIFSLGISIATPTVEYSNVITSEDNADVANTQSLVDDLFANVQPDEGGTTQDIIGTGPAGAGSFDTLGFTLNYSAVDVVDSMPAFVLAIEGEPSTVDNLSAIGITTTPVCGTPALAQVHALTAIGITADPTLGVPTATHIHNLTAIGITADPTLGVPTATHIHVLTAVGITADPVLDTPTVGQIHDFTSIGITASPVLGVPTATHIHVLTAVGITASPVLDTPTATHIHNLTAVDITADPVLGVPTASHIHDLTSVGISTTPVLDTPALAQVHALTAIDITANPVLDTPTLSTEGEDNLEANGITADPVFGTPAIGQTHALSSVGISTTPVIGAPTLSLVDILDATSITTTAVVEESTIGQTHALSSIEIYTTPVTGTPILSHIHGLNATSIIVTPTVETSSIGQIHILDATTILVSPILDVPVIGETNILSAIGIMTTPEMGVPSFKLIEGIVFIVFSAYQPEIDFDAYQPEIDFDAYQPEMNFIVSMED